MKLACSEFVIESQQERLYYQEKDVTFEEMSIPLSAILILPVMSDDRSTATLLIKTGKTTSQTSHIEGLKFNSPPQKIKIPLNDSGQLNVSTGKQSANLCVEQW